MADKTKTEAKTVSLSTRKIHPSRFKEASGVRNVWVIVPEEGTSYETILAPTYWVHISNKLRPTDRIEVLPEDGSYYAELIVRDAGNLFANVTELRKVDLDKTADAKNDKYEVKWRGPHSKFAVVRVADNQAIQDGFDHKDAAFAWLSQNLRSLAA